jgi:hypothetical protein
VARDQSALPSGQWLVAGGQLPEKDVRGNSSAQKWPVVSGFTSGQWLVTCGQLPESELVVVNCRWGDSCWRSSVCSGRAEIEQRNQ